MIALMTRAFYSVHDSRTPLFGGVLGIAILYLLNVIFRNLTGIGIAGTALAYSMSQFVIMMVYMLLFRRKTGIDIITDNFGYIVKAMIGAVPTGIAVYGLSVLIRPDIGSKISQIAAICVPVAVGLGLFWLILLKLRVSEIKFINDLVLSKLKIFRRS